MRKVVSLVLIIILSSCMASLRDANESKINLGTEFDTRSVLDYQSIRLALANRTFSEVSTRRTKTFCDSLFTAVKDNGIQLVEPIITTDDPKHSAFELPNRCVDFDNWARGVANSRKAFFGMATFGDMSFEIYEMGTHFPLVFAMSEVWAPPRGKTGGYQLVNPNTCTLWHRSGVPGKRRLVQKDAHSNRQVELMSHSILAEHKDGFYVIDINDSSIAAEAGVGDRVYGNLQMYELNIDSSEFIPICGWAQEGIRGD